MSQKSNIMRFLKNSKIAQEIVQEVSEDEKITKIILCEEEKYIQETPKVISKVSPQYQ